MPCHTLPPCQNQTGCGWLSVKPLLTQLLRIPFAPVPTFGVTALLTSCFLRIPLAQCRRSKRMWPCKAHSHPLSCPPLLPPVPTLFPARSLGRVQALKVDVALPSSLPLPLQPPLLPPIRTFGVTALLTSCFLRTPLAECRRSKWMRLKAS